MAPRVREICERYGQVYNTGSFAKQFGSVARQLVQNALPTAPTSPAIETAQATAA
jgi:linoleoyl-CoA desaturase